MGTAHKAWAAVHELHVYKQVEQRVADSRWVEAQPTGLVHALCNCGYSSGWIPDDELPSRSELVAAHGVPFGSILEGAIVPKRKTEQATTHMLTLTDQLWAAQVRVYERQAEAAQARADLAHREAALNEALTQMNSVVTSLLLNATGEELGDTTGS